MKRVLLFGFLFTLSLVACNSEDDDTTFFPDAPANPDKAKILQLINTARLTGKDCGAIASVVAPAVSWNDTLASVAISHSQDMHAADKLSHTGTNGSFLGERLTAAGYVYTHHAENLLKGGATEEEAIDIWLNSQGHCLNIMNAELLEIGVGTSGPYWTLVMASH